MAKVYLMKWHADGQLPFAPLVIPTPHGDAVVRRCEAWLREHFREEDAVGRVVTVAAIPERTLHRRFKAATGSSLLEYLQGLRVEEAKRLLETSTNPVAEVSERAGYADASFFRRLFKRLTGLTPGQYRRMFSAPGSTR